MKNPWEIKVERAYELIECLDIEIKGYFDKSPPVVQMLKVAEPDLYTVVLKELHPIPERWGAIVGDVIHNARSALDSLMFRIITQRAQAEGVEVEKHKIFFPYEINPKLLRSRADRGQKWHQGLATEDLFLALDPYMPYYEDLNLPEVEVIAATDNADMTILRELSNADKHRAINVTLCALDFAGFALPAGVEIKDVRWQPYPWNVGTEIYQVRIKGVTDESQPKLFYKFEVGLERDVRPTDAHSVINRLRGLVATVESCISSLSGFVVTETVWTLSSSLP